MYLSVWSPIILVEFLLAPTVPSPPRPQNLHSLVPAAEVIGAGLTSGSERLVTSSTIPIVNLFLGASFSNSLYTAKIDEGGVSLEPRPYLPPTNVMSLSPASRSVVATSRKRGSPREPGSFVLSSTAIFLAVLGITFKIASDDHGL